MPSALSQFEKSLVYEWTCMLPEWRQDLDALRLMDARAERLRKTWLQVNIVVGVVTVCCIVFGLVALESLPRGSYGLVLGVPAMLLVIGLVRYSAIKRHDVENRRYELAAALLELLARDLARGEPIDLRMSLLPADHPARDRKRFEANGWHVTAYSDPWLRLHGKLLDGTRFTLTVREHLELRTKWKRTSRGKYREKNKRKEGLSATLKLRPGEEQLARLRAALTGRPKLKLPGEARLEGVAVKDDAALVHVWLPGRWTHARGERSLALDVLALTFIGMYQLMGEAPPEARAP